MEECWACHGDKDCPRCAPDGDLECEACGGSMVCPACDGVGKLPPARLTGTAIDDEVAKLDRYAKGQMTSESGTQGARNIERLKKPADEPYLELGSVEGYIHKVERDGRNRPILHITTRLTGDDVKCIVKGDALRKLGGVELGDIWNGVRVLVFGTLKYKALGKLDAVESDAVQFYDADADLPGYEDIVDPDFTRGTETIKYLEGLRGE